MKAMRYFHKTDMIYKTIVKAIFLFLGFVTVASAEPVVLTGKMLPQLLGTHIDGIRISGHAGNAIPFQIDEIDSAGEYVCDRGSRPNHGSGILTALDEIVFLREDADTICPDTSAPQRSIVAIGHGHDVRFVTISDNASIPLSTVSYVNYDDVKEKVTTPYYYACFGHDRFHFTSAGIMDPAGSRYINLTKELKIKIFCRALWGILPITYTENNLVCLVRRYKVGPIRLIRRGDFHLNLGFLLQGSHAAVNQICYPDMVRVPVYVHLPVRFKRFFSEAYIEMTPVLGPDAAGYTFSISQKNATFTIGNSNSVDTLISCNPNHVCATVQNSVAGYGWLLDASVDDRYLENGSGFIFKNRMKSDCSGVCGFRLTVRDMPKGYYYIGNWVLFSHADRHDRLGVQSLVNACESISQPAEIRISGFTQTYCNQLNTVQKYKK